MADVIENTDWAEWGVRYFARGSALIWALSWVIFGLASGIGEGLAPGGILSHTALPGLIFLATVLIAWRWQSLGAILLLFEGSMIATYFLTDLDRISFLGIFFVMLTGTLPSFFIGFLFILSCRKSKDCVAEQNENLNNSI